MKVNFISGRTSHENVLKYLMSNVVAFAQEYDVDQYNAMSWIKSQENGLHVYAKWLVDHRIVNASAYALKNDDGEMVALGLDILEDELFTLMMMKIK